MFRRLLAALGIPRRRSASSPSLRDEIAKLERQAQAAPVESSAQLCNRVGDLYVKAGERERAIPFYGRAIDAYLETGYFDAAAAMCRKLIDLSPDVVRARCTLAFLSLGKGLVKDAETEILDYVRASQRAGQDDFAVERLRLMAEATDDQEIRLLLAELLTELGDAEGANEVFGAVYAERNQVAPPAPHEDQRERWARLLRVAVTGPAKRNGPTTLAAD